jgi:hypothetical protein
MILVGNLNKRKIWRIRDIDRRLKFFNTLLGIWKVEHTCGLVHVAMKDQRGYQIGTSK